MKVQKNVVNKCLAIAFLAASGFAQAQATKIGLVEVARIEESPQYKASAEKINREFSERNKRLEKAAADFRGMVEKYQRDAPTLNESQRLTRQRELAEKEKSLNLEGSALNSDVGQRRNEELVMLSDKVNKAIKKVADAEQLDLVITDTGGVVYRSEKINITPKVLRELANVK